MVLEAARLAVRNMLAPETRTAFWRILGLTILLLVGGWVLVREVFVAYLVPWIQTYLPTMPDWVGWIGFLLGIVASLGLAAAFVLLIAPVTAIIAGLFLDGVAEVIENRDYPGDPPGQAVPTGQAAIYTVRFLGVVILGNLLALMLLLVPGINLIAFFVINGYLFGREFFEFAAMRFRSEEEVRQMRSKHGMTIFFGGLIIAAVLAIPIVNLLTPVFGASMMVYLHKMISHRDPEISV